MFKAISDSVFHVIRENELTELARSTAMIRYLKYFFNLLKRIKAFLMLFL